MQQRATARTILLTSTGSYDPLCFRTRIAVRTSASGLVIGGASEIPARTDSELCADMGSPRPRLRNCEEKKKEGRENKYGLAKCLPSEVLANANFAYITGRSSDLRTRSAFC